MELELNTSKRDSRIKAAHDDAMTKISQSLADGNPVIDLYIDKDIASDVRELIDKTIDEAGKTDKFDYVVLRRERNTLGHGRMMHFTSEIVGDKKHYKLKYSV